MKKYFLMLLSIMFVTATSVGIVSCGDDDENEIGPSNASSAESSSGKTPAGLQAVDLGFPSGLKWANMNIGATSEEGYGLYFAWGETTGYGGDASDGRQFSFTTYKWCNGKSSTLTKYCTVSEKGTVDNKTVLDADDDAATVNWGDGWRMPTREEMAELSSNTTREWTEINGVKGCRFTSKINGNSIFLPAAGYRGSSSSDTPPSANVGKYGPYYSSSLDESKPQFSYSMEFRERNGSLSFATGSEKRSLGYNIRAVKK